eukprot:scaffold198444_cov40-Prasinocladus_malaysianus.AAC.1
MITTSALPEGAGAASIKGLFLVAHASLPLERKGQAGALLCWEEYATSKFGPSLVQKVQRWFRVEGSCETV